MSRKKQIEAMYNMIKDTPKEAVTYVIMCNKHDNVGAAVRLIITNGIVEFDAVRLYSQVYGYIPAGNTKKIIVSYISNMLKLLYTLDEAESQAIELNQRYDRMFSLVINGEIR